MIRPTTVVFYLLLFVHAAAARDLSIHDLATRPMHFNGKRVSVIGYFVAAHEEICLYPTRKAALRAHKDGDLDLPHVVWIEFVSRANESVLNNHYGRFIGTFRYRHVPKHELTGFGQWGLFSFQLDVTSYEPSR
jgi:hypothetical protein